MKPKFKWWWVLTGPEIGLTMQMMQGKDKKNEDDGEKPKPLEVPTTEIGTHIGVLFGRRLVEDPIVVNYGDLKVLKVVPKTSTPPAGKKG